MAYLALGLAVERAEGGFECESGRERAWAQEHNISFLVVARAAAERRAERRRRPTTQPPPNIALAVILRFGRDAGL